MKKLIFTMLALVFTGTFAFAQTESGSIMLGGNLGMNYSGSTTTTDPASAYDIDSRTTAFINPQAGYFVSDNFAVGIGLGLNFTNDKTKAYNSDEELQSTVSNLTTAIGGNLFARYYARPADMLGIFGQLTVGGGVSNTTFKTVDEINDVETEVEGDPTANFNIGIRPGITFFPTEHWGIDLLVGRLGFDATFQNLEDNPAPGVDTQNTTANFDFGIDFRNVGLGVNYYF